MKNKKSKTGFLVLAVLLCLGIVWVCTITGAASVSISDANRILLNKLFHLNVSLEEISKGIPAGSTSPYSLYNESIASFTTGELYNHKDADGFINLFGLSMKVRAMMMENNKNK